MGSRLTLTAVVALNLRPVLRLGAIAAEVTDCFESTVSSLILLNIGASWNHTFIAVTASDSRNVTRLIAISRDMILGAAIVSLYHMPRVIMSDTHPQLRQVLGALA